MSGIARPRVGADSAAEAALAALIVAMMAVGAAAATIGGTVAQTAAGVLGIAPGLTIVWNVVRFPITLALMLAVFALLYYFTPNVRHPRVRWVSAGALVAVTIWILASTGFVVYFANFSSFERSYGAIGGALVFLLWLWLTNWALLVDGEFEAELERMRQLRSGMDAEKRVRLPMPSGYAGRVSQPPDPRCVEGERDQGSGTPDGHASRREPIRPIRMSVTARSR